MLPDLSRYDRFAIDTETTGVGQSDRPVGISIATPDGRSWYLRWSHERGENNCTLAEIQAWARVEFYRPKQIKIFFNAMFDLRMLVHAGICGPELFPGIEDAGTSAALLNEHENSYTLDRLSRKHLGEEKDETFLNEWCAAQFGGPVTKQKENYWRAPGNVVEPYACGDAELTLHLYDRNRPLITEQGLNRVYETETAIIYTVVRMNLAGVQVDRTRTDATKAQIDQQLSVARARWVEIAAAAGVAMPEDWVNPSVAVVVPVFDSRGIPYGRTKPSKRFPNGQASITKAHLEASEDEAATVLEAVRDNAKLSGTFIDTIIELGGEDGIIHGEFHPLPVEYVPGKKYGAVSGRFSARLLHQIPGDRNPAVGKLIRSLFVPAYEGGQWVKADYSQIEYRFLAHYAGGVVAEEYRRPIPTSCKKCGGPLIDGWCVPCNQNHHVDFHDMVRDLINNPDFTRTRIKNVNFGELYGMGLATGAATAGVSIDKWKEIKATYHEKTGGVIAVLSQAVKDAAARRGYIVTWGGRRCRYFSAAEARAMGWKVHPAEKFVGTYKALNNLLQGSAGDLMKYAMVRVARDLVDWKNVILHLTVHDELDFTAPKGEAGAKFQRQLREAMTEWSELDGVPKLKVPIRVEIATGPSWGETTKQHLEQRKAA